MLLPWGGCAAPGPVRQHNSMLRPVRHTHAMARRRTCTPVGARCAASQHGKPRPRPRHSRQRRPLPAVVTTACVPTLAPVRHNTTSVLGAHQSHHRQRPAEPFPSHRPARQLHRSCVSLPTAIAGKGCAEARLCTLEGGPSSLRLGLRLLLVVVLVVLILLRVLGQV